VDLPLNSDLVGAMVLTHFVLNSRGEWIHDWRLREDNQKRRGGPNPQSHGLPGPESILGLERRIVNILFLYFFQNDTKSFFVLFSKWHKNDFGKSPTFGKLSGTILPPSTDHETDGLDLIMNLHHFLKLFEKFSGTILPPSTDHGRNGLDLIIIFRHFLKLFEKFSGTILPSIFGRFLKSSLALYYPLFLDAF
jgi:hypothetical protein